MEKRFKFYLFMCVRLHAFVQSCGCLEVLCSRCEMPGMGAGV